jgi:hypothetical protein
MDGSIVDESAGNAATDEPPDSGWNQPVLAPSRFSFGLSESPGRDPLGPPGAGALNRIPQRFRFGTAPAPAGPGPASAGKLPPQ